MVGCGSVRVGGFVIHGDNVASLGGCLADLRAACDEVVAVDSSTTEAGAAPCRELGVRRVALPWQGFGAARAAAAQALAGCDWVFFLDADERLASSSLDEVRRACSSGRAPAYRCAVRDWAGRGAERFLYRQHYRVRLLERARGGWAPRMVVHEQSGAGRVAVRSAIVIDHDFAPDPEARQRKHVLYAWLWATRAFTEGGRMKHPGFERLVHFVKDALLKGGALRGGWVGARLAWSMSEYHALKYECLRALRRGEAPALPSLYRSEQYAALFAAARAQSAQ